MQIASHRIRNWAILAALVCVVALSSTAYCARSSGSGRNAALGVVVIDAGHGGRDPGTHGRGRVLEKDVDLAIAGTIAAELRRKGVQVVMTRGSDRYVSLEQRVNLANQRRARLFVSIHCDSNPDRSMTGFSVLVPEPSSAQSPAAARAIASRLQRTGAQRRTLRRDDRGLYVLNATHSPAVLVEVGFLSNRREGENLVKTAYQKKAAGAIAQGIVDFLRRN